MRWPRALPYQPGAPAAARERSGWAGAGGVAPASRRQSVRPARQTAARAGPLAAGQRSAGWQQRGAAAERGSGRGGCVRLGVSRGGRRKRGGVGRVWRAGRRRRTRRCWRCRILRCGRRGIRGGRLGGAQPAAQGGKQRLGVQAQFGRQAIRDLHGERGKHQAERVGIALLDRRVEERAGFGREAGMGLRGERDVVAVGQHRATGRLPRAAEPARQPAGAGWLGRRNRRRRTRPACGGLVRGGSRPGRVLRCRLEGAIGAGRRRPPATAGESDAGGDDVAHGGAEAAEDAHTTPLGGLGRKAGREGCGLHSSGDYMHYFFYVKCHSDASRHSFWNVTDLPRLRGHASEAGDCARPPACPRRRRANPHAIALEAGPRDRLRRDCLGRPCGSPAQTGSWRWRIGWTGSAPPPPCFAELV